MSEEPTYTPEPVIPDSIEPWRGYKALNIGEGGYLSSPSYPVTWPAMKPFEAMCANTEWGWVPKEGEPRSMDDTLTVSDHRLMFATAVSSSSSSFPRTPSAGPRPNNPLPEGWNWSWEMLTHDVPAQNCSCGCYAARTPKQCVSYMSRQSGIIVEVAMWGRVVPAHDGARGQFAYPQRILAPRVLLPACRETALLYNIPILILDPVESEKICTAATGCECGATCSVTGEAREDYRGIQVEFTPPAPIPGFVPVEIKLGRDNAEEGGLLKELVDDATLRAFEDMEGDDWDDDE